MDEYNQAIKRMRSRNLLHPSDQKVQRDEISQNATEKKRWILYRDSLVLSSVHLLVWFIMQSE